MMIKSFLTLIMTILFREWLFISDMLTVAIIIHLLKRELTMEDGFNLMILLLGPLILRNYLSRPLEDRWVQFKLSKK